MNRQSIATKIETAGRKLADRIDPPQYGVRIVWDEGYEIDGATAWGEPEDSEYAAETRAKLESGEWIVVGVVAIQRNARDTLTVHETDRHASLWGIVTDASDLAGTYIGGQVWDLDDLRGYLRTVADELIAEARP